MRRPGVWILGTVVVVGGTLALLNAIDPATPGHTGPHPAMAASTRPQAAGPSLEYKLACIDSGETVKADDPRVAEWRRTLDVLERKTRHSSREQIGDVLVTVQQIMDGKHQHEGLIDLAHHVSACIGPGQEKLLPIDQVAAVYATLRTTRQ